MYLRFYECHIVRHSVMLVGMPFSGKTTALNCLQKTLTDLANEGIMHAGCAVHQAGGLMSRSWCLFVLFVFVFSRNASIGVPPPTVSLQKIRTAGTSILAST